MTTEKKVATGQDPKELRKMADDLVAHKIDLDIKWRDGDRERYAEVLRKTADLLDVAPCVSVAASLETVYLCQDEHRRRSPVLVAGHSEVKNTKKLGECGRVMQQSFVQSSLIENQIDSFLSTLGADKAGYLCALIGEAFSEAQEDGKEHIRYTILKELEDVLSGYVKLTAKGEKKFQQYTVKKNTELLAKLFFGCDCDDPDDDDDDDDDDECECDKSCDKSCACGCQRDEEDEKLDEIIDKIFANQGKRNDIKVVELKGEVAEKVGKALIGEIVKGGNDDDCTGGKCKKSCKKD